MANVKKVIEEEKAQFVSQLEPSSKRTNPCKRRLVFCRRFGLYVFPVCALVASLVLVSLAFKTPRPGVSLGFSFLLFILAIVYCVVANALKFFCLSSDGRDSESEKTYVTVVIASLEEGELATNTVV